MSRRWRADDDATLGKMWQAYASADEIAAKLGRSSEAVRRQAFCLGLRRSRFATHWLANAPPHLRPVLLEQGAPAFVEAVRAHVAAAKEAKRAVKAEKAVHDKEVADRINGDSTLCRDEKIRELRRQGITLQAIGDMFGLTRERVRQIVPDPINHNLEIYRLYAEGKTLQEIGIQYGISARRAQRIVRKTHRMLCR